MTARDRIFKGFDKWMSFPDKTVLDVTCGTILANRMEGLPIFLALVGPSSSGKSVVIEATNDLPDTYPLSKITSKTFSSGYKAKGAGLLEELGSDHPWILTFKDFTTILSMPRSEKAEIMAQLREIYDGEFVGRWGSTKKDTWKGKIGLILGCTGAWDRVSPEFGSLGERFVAFRMPDVDDLHIADRGIRSAVDSDLMEDELRDAMSELNTIQIPKAAAVPKILYPDREHLRLLATMTARARTPVTRNYVTRAVEDLPEVEKPGRLAGQLAKLAEGIALFKGEPHISEGTRDVVDKVALGSISRERMLVFRELAFEGETVDGFAKRMGLAKSPVGRALMDLRLLGMTSLGEGGYRPADAYVNFFALARGLQDVEDDNNGNNGAGVDSVEDGSSASSN